MIDPILYHYTSWQALLGILESGRMWATDWRMLNDSMEYRLGREILFDVIADQPKSLHLTHLRKVMTEIESGRESGSESIFVVSFSEHGDDLSQWRSYAADAAGVSIGFHRTTLRSTRLSLKRVRYDEDAHRRRLATVLKQQLADPTAAPELRAQARALIRACMAYKHSGFSAESEHRLVSTSRSDVRFRSRDDALVPYREVALPLPKGVNEGPPFIAEIVVGPRAHIAAEETLRAYVRSWAVKPAIRKSQIPYR